MQVHQPQLSRTPEVGGWIISLEPQLDPFVGFAACDCSSGPELIPDLLKESFVGRGLGVVLGGSDGMDESDGILPGV